MVLALGFKDLGESLDARPAPLHRGSLRDRGVYSWVRHPIYGGLVLAAFGWALRSSPWALLPAAALAVELDLKRRVEEVVPRRQVRGIRRLPGPGSQGVHPWRLVTR